MKTINWTYQLTQRSIMDFAAGAGRELNTMLRALTTLTAWELMRWCAYALILLAPGSLVVLPVLWAVRAYRKGMTMNNHAETIVERLRHWWRSRETVDEYLAAATDHADIERRLRELERSSGGPAFVTFNH